MFLSNTDPNPPLLAVRQLRIQYPGKRWLPWQAAPRLRAVDDVNFNLRRGETLGVVGESGSGKSTLARALVGLQPITAGSVRFGGTEIKSLDKKGWRALRRDIQKIGRAHVGTTGNNATLVCCLRLQKQK